MVLFDPQEFGGLEEYVASLAAGLCKQGHKTSVLSATWVPQDNQYIRRFRETGIAVIQPPRWLSYLASHWETKEIILAKVIWLSTPFIYLLSSILCLSRRQSWEKSLVSARNFLRGFLMDDFIGPDRRKPLTRLLLHWWRFRWNPDILHIQGYTNTLLFVIEWAHARHVPVVYEEHQTPDAQFDWWQGFEQSINKASVIIAVSDTSAQALRTVCKVSKPILISNPLLPDPIASGWQMNQRSRSEDAPLRITTLARLSVAKGLTYLLEAILRVKETYPASQFRVYGDGPLRQELMAYAEKLGLDGNAIFVGAFTEREELSHIMAQTDIFVMSSILEGQPLSLVEAMAYGCPIVTTSVGGIPEIIQDGVNGLLCKPKNPECLAQKIVTLIENPSLRERLSQMARESYDQGPFHPASVCDHFISIYQNTLQPELHVSRK
jgi:glycosyltransferase involved in cell wall biosynthesis